MTDLSADKVFQITGLKDGRDKTYDVTITARPTGTTRVLETIV